MCICVCICMCFVSVCVFVCVLYLHEFMCVGVSVCVFVCVYLFICVYVYVFMYVHVYFKHTWFSTDYMNFRKFPSKLWDLFHSMKTSITIWLKYYIRKYVVFAIWSWSKIKANCIFVISSWRPHFLFPSSPFLLIWFTPIQLHYCMSLYHVSRPFLAPSLVVLVLLIAEVLMRSLVNEGS